jgi:hypothetical protein
VDLAVGGGGHRGHCTVCGLLRPRPFEHDDVEQGAGEAERDVQFGVGGREAGEEQGGYAGAGDGNAWSHKPTQPDVPGEFQRG